MTLKAPVYLDNNSSTAVAPEVLASMLDVLQNHFGNPASSTHVQGWYAEELVKIAREQVAGSIGSSPEEIAFVSGATEANNMLLQGLLVKGARVVSAATEHKSILEPLSRLADTVFLSLDRGGSVSLAEVEQAVSANVSLLVLMIANNEIGTIQPLREISAICRKYSVPVFTDATQAVGKLLVDVKDLGVDYLSFSAHKLYGPKGVGALYVRTGAKPPQPLLFGGMQENGLRAGTLNVPAIVGFGKACALLNLAQDISHISSLTERLFHGLKSIFPDLVLNGPALGPQRLLGNLNCSFPGHSSAKILAKIQAKVSVSTGSACQSKNAKPSHVLQALGLKSEEMSTAIRFGVGRYNTAEEIEMVLASFKEALSSFPKSKP